MTLMTWIDLDVNFNIPLPQSWILCALGAKLDSPLTTGGTNLMGILQPQYRIPMMGIREIPTKLSSIIPYFYKTPHGFFTAQVLKIRKFDKHHAICCSRLYFQMSYEEACIAPY